MSVLSNKWFKFGVVLCLYLLWALWVKSWWLLVGVPVIYDIYISKKVHWAFWKKKGVEKQTKVVEWVDALIFAVVAATLIRMFFFEAYTIPSSSMEKTMLVGDYLFVSKVAYGPKLPNTPLAVPFTHHTLPFTRNAKAYSEAVRWPYKRIAGIGEMKRNDIVVFNFPAGDTVILGAENPDYYTQLRTEAEAIAYMARERGIELTPGKAIELARVKIWDENEVIARPVDKRENYIKRCVGMPGDVLEMKNSVLHVNGVPEKAYEGLQHCYRVRTNGTPFSRDRLKEVIGLSYDDFAGNGDVYWLHLTADMLAKLQAMPNVVSVEKIMDEGEVFPYSPHYPWTRDNSGPFTVPKKGETVAITVDNLPLYERIIDVYEDNDLQVRDSVVYINGEPATSYTFKMDYFWMLGDNRHNSLDSRYWGFVPEDHIVGKAYFIWLSMDKDKSFPFNIRWDRMFRFVH